MLSAIPNYESLVPVMMKWIRDRSEIERRALEFFSRNAEAYFDLARAAGRYRKMSATAAEAKALPYVADALKRLTEKKDRD